MQVLFRTRDADVTPELVLEADRELRHAVGRLARRVSGIAVRLFDLNGPRGGVDKACEVTVSLGRAGTVHYRAVASSAAAAIRLAVSGIRDVVKRRVALRRESRRRQARRRRSELAGNPA